MTALVPPSPPPARRWRARAVVRAGNRWRRLERYIKSKLLWSRFFGATSYLRSALWTIPFIAIVLVFAITPMLRTLDELLGWRIMGLGAAGAQSLYETTITLTLSFLVFTFGSLLVAIQVAGGQLTPRVIATILLRDNVVRYSVGIFVFTLLFAVMALNRVEAKIWDLATILTSALAIGCMAMFLFLIDHAARLLRPVSIVAHVGDEGMSVIESVYRQPAPEPTASGNDATGERRPPHRIVLHAGRSEIVLAVDLETLVDAAAQVDGVVEFIPQVGDFVAYGEPLFALHGGAAGIDDRTLHAAVAFGSERTMEQDPLFAFRILVDIALKALSPAINDPTTAVVAIDQIHRLLREVGRRELHRDEVVDGAGRTRVIFRTPNWDDFVHLACTEIRNCGAGSVQVARRLQSMLVNLISTLPEYRDKALEEERDRLNRVLPGYYGLPEDLALARMPDAQGLGGSGSDARLPAD
jgi:uncharacterized membrane protein